MVHVEPLPPRFARCLHLPGIALGLRPRLAGGKPGPEGSQRRGRLEGSKGDASFGIPVLPTPGDPVASRAQAAGRAAVSGGRSSGFLPWPEPRRTERSLDGACVPGRSIVGTQDNAGLWGKFLREGPLTLVSGETVPISTGRRRSSEPQWLLQAACDPQSAPSVHQVSALLGPSRLHLGVPNG